MVNLANIKESRRLYHDISRVLTVGIAASITLMIFGFILLLVGRDSTLDQLPNLAQLLQGVLNLDASSVIWLATLILILTPIARVIASIILFSLEKDRRYFLITLSVLILLIVSFIVGLATS